MAVKPLNKLRKVNHRTIAQTFTPAERQARHRARKKQVTLDKLILGEPT
jgi:hypothetical protein